MASLFFLTKHRQFFAFAFYCASSNDGVLSHERGDIIQIVTECGAEFQADQRKRFLFCCCPYSCFFLLCLFLFDAKKNMYKKGQICIISI